MTPVTDHIDRYFQQRFGFGNSKGDAILQKKCWIGTVPEGDSWKTVFCEPLIAEDGVCVFRITCETEKDSPFHIRDTWQELVVVGPKAKEIIEKLNCRAVVIG